MTRPAPTSIARQPAPFRGGILALVCLSAIAEPPPLVAQDGLTAGQSLAREIQGSESHVYDVAIDADRYFSAVIEQQGVDVIARLVGPDGATSAEVNDATGPHGTEILTFIAAARGEYRLEVRASEKNASRGRYALLSQPLRPPTADERTLEGARRLLDQARDLRRGGHYKQALPLAERGLALRESVLGADHRAVAGALHLVAVLLDDIHDYTKAEAPNLRALAIREKAFGPDHPDVARSLFNLAWLAKVAQDFAKAEALYQRALGIQERAFGLEHPEVATTLNDLAVLYNQTGRFDESIAVNERVVAIREKTLGPGDGGVAKALNNLARGYENKGDYAQAEAHLRHALEIWEAALGSDHPEVAFAVDGLARVLHANGDYTAAEPLFLRALAIREKALGPNHTEVATTLHNLAVLHREKGDYVKAASLSLRDLAITEQRLGPHHAFLGPTLTNLARIDELQGDHARAEARYRRALTIQETALGSTHAAVGLTLNRLGRLYADKPDGDPAEAEALLRRALTTLEDAVGPDHPGVASSLSGLASLAERTGDRPAAEQYHQRALAIHERVHGPIHPEVAQSLDRLAALAASNGDPGRAVTLLARAYDIRQRHLDHNLLLGSERQKREFLELFAGDAERAVSLHASLAPRDAAALDLAFTTVLGRKGRVLDAISDNVALLRAHASSADRALFDRLFTARSQLAAVTLRGPAGTAAAYRAQLARLRDEVDRLEVEVAARSAAFRAQSSAVTLDSVRAALPDDAALVEYVSYRPAGEAAEPRGAPRLAAYVLSRQGDPQWVDLGDTAAIERSVSRWRRALGSPARTDVRRLARELDAMVMEPIRALIGDAHRLLISPDGQLNLVPFAALVDRQNRYLIERYTISYLTSGRDLLRLQIPRAVRSDPVIVAAPAFGEPALVAAAAGAKRAQVDESQIFFAPLPGTAVELRALRALFPRAAVLSGEQATEAALRRVSGPRVLHIATHGFFLPASDTPTARAPQPEATGTDTRLGKGAAWSGNPMLRSGLALAGANQGQSGTDDGLLTALEAASLDLWGTRLVVLSACDTGLGEVRTGDGVYGLRRALILAGSETQMMSLWPVSDRSTRDLMVAFYTRLTESVPRSDALRQVQLQMLGDDVHGHPYYWASFIQSGAWWSLDGAR